MDLIQERIKYFRENTDFVLTLFGSAIGYAIIAADFDGNIITYNEGARQICGYAAEEIIGKETIEKFFPREFIEVGKLEKIIKELISKERFSHEVEMVRKDGSRFPAQVLLTLTKDKNSKVVGFIEIVQDLTESKRAEEQIKNLNEDLESHTLELKAANKELEQANIYLSGLDKLKSMFIASMSHELRTPLNSIIGFTGIILQGMVGKINKEQRKQLTMVKNSAHHLLTLINDIIDLSKIEAGKVELSIEPFAMSVLGREVKDSFEGVATESGLKMSLNVPETLIIESDRRRVKQVFMNFVSNAGKFTNKGSIEIDIEKENQRVKASVRDTGIGIRKEDMDKLFKPFSQILVEGQLRQEGTGLGLYLSKKIVTLLGGEINAESEFGKGSVFTFILPLKRGLTK